ncbi:MAG: hypothetical protein NC218_06895 [Acetobacter sp.]|nr:hypothetical protein [Acetobacter sp.]
MSLKSEKKVDNAVRHTNQTLTAKLKRFSKNALLFGSSLIAVSNATAPQMYAQSPQTVSVNVNDLDAYLKRGRTTVTQPQQQKYAQVYANRDAYRAQRQGITVDGDYAYENGKVYAWSNEFGNEAYGNRLNDRVVLGVYENTNGYNDYIMITAPLDHYGNIIPDGKLSANHYTYEYLRDAKQQGHTGFSKQNNSRRGYYAPHGPHHRPSKAGRVVHEVGHTVERIINLADYISHGR